MFMFKKYRSQSITIDTSGTSATSPDVEKRLQRIQQNYAKLDEILIDLETRIEMDDRLTESVVPEAEAPLPRKPR